MGHFHIPGDATRREFAVYVMVATHRQTGEIKFYVGKTGDNRVGCNPVISRAGNHFSFNEIHSQMRNYLAPAEPYEFNFDYFYTTFGEYDAQSPSRDAVDLVNEMERQLNRLARMAFSASLLNPYDGKHVRKATREQRQSLATESRFDQLSQLIESVVSFIDGRDRHPVAEPERMAESIPSLEENKT
ncbi:MAG: hypothetical protein ACKV2Q_01300 [Planctomycetaceae bacterium]